MVFSKTASLSVGFFIFLVNSFEVVCVCVSVRFGAVCKTGKVADDLSAPTINVDHIKSRERHHRQPCFAITQTQCSGEVSVTILSFFLCLFLPFSPIKSSLMSLSHLLVRKICANFVRIIFGRTENESFQWETFSIKSLMNSHR